MTCCPYSSKATCWVTFAWWCFTGTFCLSESFTKSYASSIFDKVLETENNGNCKDDLQTAKLTWTPVQVSCKGKILWMHGCLQRPHTALIQNQLLSYFHKLNHFYIWCNKKYFLKPYPQFKSIHQFTIIVWSSIITVTRLVVAARPRQLQLPEVP